MYIFNDSNEYAVELRFYSLNCSRSESIAATKYQETTNLPFENCQSWFNPSHRPQVAMGVPGVGLPRSDKSTSWLLFGTEILMINR